MHLAYIDDSGSDKPSPIVVVGAAIIDDRDFFLLDTRTGVIVEGYIPSEKLESFEEFHASELFGGYGFFHGVPEEERHQLIAALLAAFKKFEIQFVYAAVDKKLLEASVFGSSHPLDVAFRICACGVGETIAGKVVDKIIKELGPDAPRLEMHKAMARHPFLLIADDTDDKALKQLLRKSFRSLRPPNHQMQALSEAGNQPGPVSLWMCHDDMFFGDSKSSIGIQLADVCTHIMFRKFRDGIQDKFYEALMPHAISAKPEPSWNQCEAFMMIHDEPAQLSLSALVSSNPALAALLPSVPPAPVEDQKKTEPSSQ